MSATCAASCRAIFNIIIEPELIFRSTRIVRNLAEYSLHQWARSLYSRRLAVCIIATSVAQHDRRNGEPIDTHAGGGDMRTPVVPNQFELGKNKMVHKPTTATLNFDTGDTIFKTVSWGRAGEQLASGQEYRKEDIMRVALKLLVKIPR
jgi:hypothetical protein